MRLTADEIGYRAASCWGEGEEMSPYAVGDIVFIDASCPAFADDRIDYPPGRYRVVSAYSIGEGPEWYFRVFPMEKHRGRWRYLPDGGVSDRIHVIPGQCDYTKGWTLVKRAVAADRGDA